MRDEAWSRSAEPWLSRLRQFRALPNRYMPGVVTTVCGTMRLVVVDELRDGQLLIFPFLMLASLHVRLGKVYRPHRSLQ